MYLFFREAGEGDPIVILHGLFGSSDNWLSIARVLSETHKVYAVDQRNHGQSPHSDYFSYEIMANDLKEFLEEHNIVNPIIIGHSMGGKVAMQFATEHPEILKKLVVVDIAPKEYPVHHDVILEGLNSIDVKNLASRNEANEQLAKYVQDIGTRQFLLKNIARTSDGFQWKINLPVIETGIEQIGIGLDPTSSYDGDTLFIRGKKSHYIQDEDQPDLLKHFPKSELETIENAGHWIHAEQPEAFLSAIKSFI